VLRIGVVSRAELTFLGTGTSVGVPVIGCGCAVCTSADPRDRRLRSSVVLRTTEAQVLVDSGPDLRQQALREGLTQVDAVLYTHGHLDHVTGFDELRAFCWHREQPLPMYATRSCMTILQTMFAWAFSAENVYRGYVKPDPRLIEGAFVVGDLRITPLPVTHGGLETIGFLFESHGAKSVAYIPDVKQIPSDTMRLIHEVDVLIVDSLRPAAHPTHFSLSEALGAIEASCAHEAWLTHLGHENSHAELEDTLPHGVRVAWDGLRISL
jgi:phosphoribosyl 1,2-cyclic phosphate phosphodiesterase